MPSTRHRQAALAGGLEIWVITAANGTSITRTSGPNFEDADVTLTDTGTGDQLITINPFKGPKGEVYYQATAGTANRRCAVTDLTYTNDSLAVTVKSYDDTSSAADSIVCLHLFAE